MLSYIIDKMVERMCVEKLRIWDQLKEGIE